MYWNQLRGFFLWLNIFFRKFQSIFFHTGVQGNTILLNSNKRNYLYLLYVRHWYRHFKYINTFNLHSSLWGRLIFTSIYRCGNWGTQRFSNLPKFIWTINGWTRVCTHAVWLQRESTFLLAVLGFLSVVTWHSTIRTVLNYYNN